MYKIVLIQMLLRALWPVLRGLSQGKAACVHGLEDPFWDGKRGCWCAWVAKKRRGFEHKFALDCISII